MVECSPTRSRHDGIASRGRHGRRSGDVGLAHGGAGRAHRQRLGEDLGLRAVVRVQAGGSFGLALRVGALGQLLEAALVRLGDLVLGEGKAGLEPLGAGDAVVASEPGQVLGGLGGLVAVEVGGRQEVAGDLVDVPRALLEETKRRRDEQARKRWAPGPSAYLVFRRVLVRVFLFVTPIVGSCSGRAASRSWLLCGRRLQRRLWDAFFFRLSPAYRG